MLAYETGVANPGHESQNRYDIFESGGDAILYDKENPSAWLETADETVIDLENYQ